MGISTLRRAFVVITTIFACAELHAQSNGVLREVWTGIPGSDIPSLTNDARFPGSPDFEEVLPDFEAPTNVLDNYGQRLRALVTAPSTGNYTFWISGDDNCELWLSTDDDPANAEMIASVPGWTASRDFTRYSEQESSSIALVAGQQYFIEALMKEGGGGDNLAVQWELPGGTIQTPIPEARLTPFGLTAPQITSHPANESVAEGDDAVFSVDLAKFLGSTFQWQRNNVDIAGETESTLVVPSVSLSDSGATFRVIVTNPQGQVTSNTATLTVVEDVVRPTIVAAVNLGDPNAVTVQFSESMEFASATDSANYSLDNGATITSVTSTGDPAVVVLQTSSLTAGESYTVTVSGVRDQATSPNTILSGSTAVFSFDFNPLEMERVHGKAEPIGPSSRMTGLIISEIMYHPADRVDMLDLEYIEIFNTHDWEDDIGGFRISGAVDFVFPEGTTIPARSYIVVAAAPGDLQNVYGVSDAYGPWTGSLPNDRGRVRLRHRIGGVYQEVNYRDRAPWPVGADGSGHSIVLSRPSFGEGEPAAWSRSNLIGGTPGQAEDTSPNPYETVVINEILAHTDDPVLDYVELYNYGNSSVDLSGCVLTDDFSIDVFTIPAGTSIPAKGFISFDQTELGFALNSGGETVLFKGPANSRVIDALRFSGQENGVAFGRFPDGAPGFQSLVSMTEETGNSRMLIRDIVINEIMYNPVSRDNDDEFFELFNKGESSVDISGWRVRGDVSLTFPEGTVIDAGGYLVVANSVTRVLANHTGLDSSMVVGDYGGSLPNGGGHISIEMPDEVIDVTESGTEVNTIWIVIDEVRYEEGGRWPEWADGGGSSLELIDPHSDNRLPSNWRDSDESGKSDWTAISHTGVLDNGQGAINELHVMLLSAGEALFDDLSVSQGGGANLLPNPDFDAGFDEWLPEGNHIASNLSENGSGFGGGEALHLIASGGGDNGANRVESDLTSNMSSGQTATISGRARWLRGSPYALLRLHGNHLELSAKLDVPANLGSPGAANGSKVDNAGPEIRAVQHYPILPSSNQAVEVRAHVSDVDGFSNIALKYRLDPSTNYTTVTMTYRGAGHYTAAIPGQSTGNIVAFYIEATDANALAGVSTFPAAPTNSECLIRFGEATAPGNGNFGTYRIWMASENLSEIDTRVRLSNQLQDCTFVLGDFRAIYNTGGRYRGSPFIRPGYGSIASGGTTAMVYEFPKDDLVLGAQKINLDGLEQPGRDDTLQRERTSMWIGEQLGVSFSYQRYVFLYVNGTRKGQVYTDSHQPDGEYIDRWYPGESNGDLFKIDDWFEFNDSVTREFNQNAQLQRYTTTGGELKQARYRWSWEKKTTGGLNDDYSSLLELVEAVNESNETTYTQSVGNLVDIDQWMGVFATRHIVGDWDGYGYNRGKNQSTFKPDNGRWIMFLWDLDFSLGGGSDGTSTSMYNANDSVVSRLYSHPEFGRAYLRAWKNAVDGPLTAAASSPVMDAVYSAFQLNNVSASNPSGIKSWIASRRSYLSTQLNGVTPAFAINNNGGGNFSTGSSTVELNGDASVEIATIEINGVAYPVTWTSFTEWSIDYPLGPGVNALEIVGYDLDGNAVAGASDTISITFTGETQMPEDHLVINEIMYNALVPDTDFVEIHNTSTTHSFDLSGLELNGVDFVFPDGTLIGPWGFLLVVEDEAAFITQYGAGFHIAGVFDGKLENSGETISIVERGLTPEEDLLIDEVSYDDRLPWPLEADGAGASLQLIDPDLDNRRVASWASMLVEGPQGGSETVLDYTDQWSYFQSGDPGNGWEESSFNDAAWSTGAGLLYVEGSDLPAPKNTPLTLGQDTYFFRTTFDLDSVSGIELSAQTILDDGAIVYLNGTEWFRVGVAAGDSGPGVFANRTVGDASVESFGGLSTAALVEGENVVAVEVHQTNIGSSDVVWGMQIVATTTGGMSATPGETNATGASTPVLPLVWLNELQPENLTGPLDGQGDGDPWVELYNSSDATISLNGYHLTDDHADPRKWAFPAGATIASGQFLVVWLDGETSETVGTEYHAGFVPAASDGSVVLTVASGDSDVIVDYLNYSNLSADRSYGAYPDGRPNKRRFFLNVTPGFANDPTSPEIDVFVNEWLADNVAFMADPADGQFEDWFELYNAGGEAIDLSGYFLTDDVLSPTTFEIPPGTVIPAGGFLHVWADDDPSQNDGSSVHTTFRLGSGGDSIALFAPDLSLVDSVTFLEQSPDVSEGRWPDGGAEPFTTFDVPTPGASNLGDSSDNTAPVLDLIGDMAVAEGVALSFTATASDSDDPAQTLTFSLGSGAPATASIDSVTGDFTWTPSESAGPGVASIQIVVTDSGTPMLSDSQTIQVTVSEVNSAPSLSPIGAQSVSEGGTLAFTAAAADGDLPAQGLIYSLGGTPPAGASIVPGTGAFSWTPTEEQGGETYMIEVVVTDTGTPALTDSEMVSITVIETNAAPLLTLIGNQTVAENAMLAFSVMASDSDLPAQTLTYGMSGAPSGATLDPNTGAFAWTPGESDGGTSIDVTFTASDSATPSGSDSETITITVTELNDAPVLASVGDQTVDEGAELAFTIFGSDSDLPAQTLTYGMSGAPAGATLDPDTGAFAWTPGESDGGTSVDVTFTVSDRATPSGSDSETITITIAEINAAPVADPIADLSTAFGQIVGFNVTATDSDLPAQTLSYALTAGPEGASVDPSTGAFSWTPTQDQVGEHGITISVSDDGSPVQSTTVSFAITVRDEDGSLRITSIDWDASTGGSLTWTTTPGVTYIVEKKDDIEDLEWTEVTRIIASGTSETITDIINSEVPTGFFRIRAETP